MGFDCSSSKRKTSLWIQCIRYFLSSVLVPFPQRTLHYLLFYQRMFRYPRAFLHTFFKESLMYVLKKENH